MNRRRFLQSSSATALVGLSACKQTVVNPRRLTVFTWVEYFDPEMIKRFEDENKCRVIIDTFDSNEAMLAKLKAGATGYDVLTPSSYMVKTLHREGMILNLDHSKLANITNIDVDYLKGALDPRMEHSVPYMMAPTCLGWLGSKVKDATPTNKMYERADLKGRITMLNDLREVIGAALKTLGHPLNSTDPKQLIAARDLVLQWKKNLAKFESEQYKPGLASGEFLLVQGYAGDLMQIAKENTDIRVEIPAEGTALSCDDLCITKTAKDPGLAHDFINFLCDPEIAAKNMQTISYRAPNKPAYDRVAPDFRKNTVLFPPDEVFAKCEPIDDLGDKLPLWTKIWDEIKAG